MEITRKLKASKHSMYKITLATIKSFIKREHIAGRLHSKSLSSFDGMVDCVMPKVSDWTKVESVNFEKQHTFNIPNIWLVGESRDYFTAYQDENFIGYEISNACGSSLIGFKRN